MPSKSNFTREGEQQKVDGDLQAPSGSVRSKTAPGGRVPPRTNCTLISWLLVVAALAVPGVFSQPAQGARGGTAATAAVWQRYIAESHRVLSVLNRAGTDVLSTPPAGVVDLSFAEFFGPIGDRGLEYSEKLRALAGQRVRLAGYMIREQDRAPGVFRLVARPLTIDTKASCAVDNAPPSAVHVFVSANAARLVPYRPGRLVLIGRLEIGPQVEADGRNSVVRLITEDAVASAGVPIEP
jgi:hypothetical protein